MREKARVCVFILAERTRVSLLLPGTDSCCGYLDIFKVRVPKCWGITLGSGGIYELVAVINWPASSKILKHGRGRNHCTRQSFFNVIFGQTLSPVHILRYYRCQSACACVRLIGLEEYNSASRSLLRQCSKKVHEFTSKRKDMLWSCSVER